VPAFVFAESIGPACIVLNGFPYNGALSLFQTRRRTAQRLGGLGVECECHLDHISAILPYESIPLEIRYQPDGNLRSTLQDSRESAERDRIFRALEQTDWNVSAAARLLNIERTNLHKRMRALGLNRGN
jgi:transcriptional regulator of acetoin/glycerol metabolism